MLSYRLDGEKGKIMIFHANKKQNIKNIVSILKDNPDKVRQLKAVQGISWTCTSDDYIWIDCELYQNHIVRYLIKGTHSSMTITANARTHEICRKKRNEVPWAVGEIQTWCYWILDKVNE